MSIFLIIVVTLIYGWVAVLSFVKADTSMSMIYAGYAFANFGLIMQMKG